MHSTKGNNGTVTSFVLGYLTKRVILYTYVYMKYILFYHNKEQNAINYCKKNLLYLRLNVKHNCFILAFFFFAQNHPKMDHFNATNIIIRVCAMHLI